LQQSSVLESAHHGWAEGCPQGREDMQIGIEGVSLRGLADGFASCLEDGIDASETRVSAIREPGQNNGRAGQARQPNNEDEGPPQPPLLNISGYDEDKFEVAPARRMMQTSSTRDLRSCLMPQTLLRPSGQFSLITRKTLNQQKQARAKTGANELLVDNAPKKENVSVGSTLIREGGLTIEFTDKEGGDNKIVTFYARPFGLTFHHSLPLVVQDVIPGSLADKGDVQPGCVFHKIGGTLVADFDCAAAVVRLIMDRSAHMPLWAPRQRGFVDEDAHLHERYESENAVMGMNSERMELWNGISFQEASSLRTTTRFCRGVTPPVGGGIS